VGGGGGGGPGSDTLGWWTTATWGIAIYGPLINTALYVMASKPLRTGPH
jgi:hypothetical protein